jgi:hypothetical protein
MPAAFAEKEASVHLTRRIDKMQKVDLCEVRQDQVNDPTGFCSPLLLGLGASRKSASRGAKMAPAAASLRRISCRPIGLPGMLQDFLGSAQRPAPMHKGTRHVGKAPEALRQTPTPVGPPEGAQKKLSRPSSEDFERALPARRTLRRPRAWQNLVG